MKTKDKVQLIQKKKSNFTFERLYGFAFGFADMGERGGGEGGDEEEDDFDDDERAVKILLGDIDEAAEARREEERTMEARRKRRREIVESMTTTTTTTTTQKTILGLTKETTARVVAGKEASGEEKANDEKAERTKTRDDDDALASPPFSRTLTKSTKEHEGKKKDKDMFDSDSEDMFGESDSEEEEEEEENGTSAMTTNGKRTKTTTRHAGGLAGKENDEKNQAFLKDNWDDTDGYYRAKLGERLDDGRYEVTETNFGKGVFSSVLKAKDLKRSDTPETSSSSASSAFVAIKIIRNNETMRKASKTEVAILKKLSDRDPEGKKHVVQFHRSFEFRGHVFLVFEKLSMNLREAAKKFGRDVGISISAVRVYARQLFVALMHLQKCGIVHADIKPDNVLVNDQLNILKLCDFGSALFNADNELTPYLASRFYRAPEVVLGLPYSFPIDLWAVGCCLYELYVGKICFPGKSNNEMLKYFVEMKGAVPKKILRKAAFKEKHFDRDENLRIAEVDKVTGKTMFRVFDNNTIAANKTGRVESVLATVCVEHGGDDFERKKARQLSDLLEKIFILDPERRITVTECLQHSFIVDTNSNIN